MSQTNCGFRFDHVSGQGASAKYLVGACLPAAVWGVIVVGLIVILAYNAFKGERFSSRGNRQIRGSIYEGASERFLNGRSAGPDALGYTQASADMLAQGVADGGTDDDSTERFRARNKDPMTGSRLKHTDTALEGIIRGTA